MRAGDREHSIGRSMDQGVTDSLSHVGRDASDAQGALATLARIEDGGFLEVEVIIGGDAESLILHRRGDSVRAWLNICPHAGRRLDWAPGKFLLSKEGLLVCAAHGASFELSDGECVAGPCRGERLRAVAVTVREGEVVLA